MFKDYTFPDWANLLGVVSFVVVLVIFLTIVVKAVRMPKREARRLSELPLEKDDTPNTQQNDKP